MKSNICIWIVICLVLVNTFSFSCTNNSATENISGQRNKGELLSVDTNSFNETFKDWLKDTLIHLYSWQKQSDIDITKKEIELGKDSLSLTTSTYYSTQISDKKKLKGEILNMIDLLKEYDELPRNHFQLSFQYQMFYYPSSVEQLRYDFVYEIKNIQIVEDSSKSKFKFIRGRLGGKEVEKKNRHGKKEIVKTDFIWKDDKLIKIVNE